MAVACRHQDRRLDDTEHGHVVANETHFSVRKVRLLSKEKKDEKVSASDSVWWSCHADNTEGIKGR